MKKVFITLAFVAGIGFVSMAQTASNVKSDNAAVVTNNASDRPATKAKKEKKSNCAAATTGTEKKSGCAAKTSCCSKSAATKED